MKGVPPPPCNAKTNPELTLKHNVKYFNNLFVKYLLGLKTRFEKKSNTVYVHGRIFLIAKTKSEGRYLVRLSLKINVLWRHSSL
jgi:hypothetical protein